jgi:hypothetical protein
MPPSQPPPQEQRSSSTDTAVKVGAGVVVGIGLGWMLASTVAMLAFIGMMFYAMNLMSDIEMEMEEYEADWEEERL